MNHKKFPGCVLGGTCRGRLRPGHGRVQPLASPGSVRAHLPHKPPSLDPQARPQHQRPERAHPRSIESAQQRQQVVASQKFQQVSSHMRPSFLSSSTGSSLFIHSFLRLSGISQQLSVWVGIREHHQPGSLQQQQQPDSLTKDAQLSEFHLWLPPTSSSHTAQQHTHRRARRQQDPRTGQG